jgi:hypothetical protein
VKREYSLQKANGGCVMARTRARRGNGGIAMRDVITLLMCTNVLCYSSAASAQVNYELFPGHGGKVGYPPTVNYHAWVISYRDSKFYDCVAGYDFLKPSTPTLDCKLSGSFNPPLLGGANVKTFQALGTSSANNDEVQSGFFWQIDQTTGQTQFCMHGVPINCVAVQLP